MVLHNIESWEKPRDILQRELINYLGFNEIAHQFNTNNLQTLNLDNVHQSLLFWIKCTILTTMLHQNLVIIQHNCTLIIECISIIKEISKLLFSCIKNLVFESNLLCVITRLHQNLKKYCYSKCEDLPLVHMSLLMLSSSIGVVDNWMLLNNSLCVIWILLFTLLLPLAKCQV